MNVLHERPHYSLHERPHYSPETALTEAVNKFVTRFKYMEARLARDHKRVEETDFDTLDALWEEAKKVSE